MDNLKPIGWTWLSFPGKEYEQRAYSEISLEEKITTLGGTRERARRDIQREVDEGSISTPEPLYTESQLTAAVEAEREERCIEIVNQLKLPVDCGLNDAVDRTIERIENLEVEG